MKKFVFLSVSFVLLIFGAYSQNAPITTWKQCFGGSSDDKAYSIIQTHDGGYIISGYSNSTDGDVSGNHGNDDVWIIRLDNSMDTLWTKCLGGSDYDGSYSIQETNDNGYIVAGFTRSNNGDVSGGNGELDMWIVKLDVDGNMMWQKCLGGSLNDVPYSVQQTSDNGYIVVGYTDSNDGDVSGNHGYDDMWVVKLDSSGNIQWQKCVGGTSYDFAQSVQQTIDGGYIIAGYTESNDGDVVGNHGNADMLVVKLDTDGNLLWSKCFGGSGYDYGYSIQQTSDSGYVIAGYTDSNDGDVSGNNGGQDFWILKLNNNGDVVWQSCLGGSSNERAYSIVQTFDGGYFVGGYSMSNNGDVVENNGDEDMWVVKLDSSGNIQWQKSVGGSNLETVQSVLQTIDGRFVVAGYTYSNDFDVSDNHGFCDMFVFKLNTFSYSISHSDVSCFGGNDGSISIDTVYCQPPVHYIWNTGDTTSSIDSLTAGTYYVTIYDNDSAITETSVTIQQPDSLAISINNGGCSGYGLYYAIVSVVGGTPPYAYLWNTGSTDSSFQVSSPGWYYITVTDANGCIAVDSVFLADTFNISLTNIPQSCFNENNGSLTVSDISGGLPPYSYVWYNATGDSIDNDSIAENLLPGVYTLQVTDANGCITNINDTLDEFVVDLSICMVTVDTVSGKCMVIWERPQADLITGFNVYRLTGSTTYSNVGYVSWDSMTVFVDSGSSPDNHPETYKISAIDTCGNEFLTPYHRTVNLQASAGSTPGTVNLVWNHYEDESGTYQPEQYYIYRKTLPTQQFYTVIDSMSALYNTYTDNSAPAGFNYYLILTDIHYSCYPSSVDKAVGGPYDYSLSNIDDYSIGSAQNMVFVPVSLYPNPMKDYCQINFYNPSAEGYRLKIVDISGRTVYVKEGTGENIILERNNLKAGIYDLKIITKEAVYTAKLIVE